MERVIQQLKAGGNPVVTFTCTEHEAVGMLNGWNKEMYQAIVDDQKKIQELRAREAELRR